MFKKMNNNGSTDEWYTPDRIVKLVHEFYKEIDLDPASCTIANKTVKARHFFTKEQNGLTKRWFGRVWLNPPYSRALIAQFIAAVMEKRDEYKEALVLVNNCTETGWFNDLMAVGSMICLIKKRVRFKNIDGELVNSPKQGQVIIYVGPDKQRFRKIFSKLGQVVEITREEWLPAA